MNTATNNRTVYYIMIYIFSFCIQNKCKLIVMATKKLSLNWSWYWKKKERINWKGKEFITINFVMGTQRFTWLHSLWKMIAHILPSNWTYNYMIIYQYFPTFFGWTINDAKPNDLVDGRRPRKYHFIIIIIIIFLFIVSTSFPFSSNLFANLLIHRKCC